MMKIIEKLNLSPEPSIRYKLQVNVLGKDPSSGEAAKFSKEIKLSSRVQALLSERDEDGKIPDHPYRKWVGAHWVLAILADLGYPPGDIELIPLREQVLDWLLGEAHQKSIKTIQGRVRRCASQEGNALWAMLKLGLADERACILAKRLISWQWPDGGWNCDKRPAVAKSSIFETLLPVRALSLFARLNHDNKAANTARLAAEVFLRRRMLWSMHDDSLINESFLQLHYPSYWYYDVLAGLKVMTEAGFILDPRCREALDLLESKRLPDGGFPAEEKMYVTAPRAKTRRSIVPWGPISRTKMNEFVTVDALYVLKMAGRLED